MGFVHSETHALEVFLSVSDRMELGCLGWVWVEQGLDMTNMNKLDRTSPPSLVLAQAGHVVTAIQEELQILPHLLPKPWRLCRYSLHGPGQMSYLALPKSGAYGKEGE